MRNLIYVLFGMFFLLSSGSLYAQKKSDPVVYFKSSMHCGDCENSLFEHLRFEKGVKDLKLDHVSNTIRIVYAEKRTGEEALKSSVENKGYSAEKITAEKYTEIVEAGKKNLPAQTDPHKH